MSEENKRLEKTLSPMHIGALALGCIIGWGCFALPTTKFLPQAGPLGTFLGLIIGVIALTFVVFAYGAMIKKFPVAGGEYAYAYAGFGPKIAFVCGWALALGYVSIVAINASAVGMISGHLLPDIMKNPSLDVYTLAGDTVNWAGIVLVSLVVIAFGWMNYRGVELAGNLQVGLSLALVVGVIAVAVGIIFFSDSFSLDNLNPMFGTGKPGTEEFTATGEGKSIISGMIVILAVAPFLFVGFDTIPQAAEEFHFPPKKARNLMLFAMIIGAFMYALMVFAIGSYKPYPELLQEDGLAKATWGVGYVVEEALGKGGIIALGIGVLGAVFAGMNGFYLATSRLLFAMARGRMLPQWFAQIHPKHKTPHNAVLFTMFVSLLTPWAGREVVIWIVDMCAVGTAIAYMLTCLSAYRTNAGNKIVAIIGALVSLIILLLLVVPGSPGAIGKAPWIALVIWTVLGTIFYLKQRKTFENTPEEVILESVFGDKNTKVYFK